MVHSSRGLFIVDSYTQKKIERLIAHCSVAHTSFVVILHRNVLNCRRGNVAHIKSRFCCALPYVLLGAVGARQGDLRGRAGGAAEASLVGPGQGPQRHLRGQAPPEVRQGRGR